MKEQLKKILGDFPVWHATLNDSWLPEAVDRLADYLIENGVVAPPVKVGQTIYILWSGGRSGIGIAEFEVRSINLDTPDDVEIVYRSKKLNATMCRYANASDIGKTLFLTREEAERALERKKI